MVTDDTSSITYADLLDSFTDREQILLHFQSLLQMLRSDQLRILAIEGNSGTGKTFLIGYLSERICPQFAWSTEIITFAPAAVPDYRTMLTNLESALEPCVSPAQVLKYRIRRDAYLHEYAQYRDMITINAAPSQTVEGEDSAHLRGIKQSMNVRDITTHVTVDIGTIEKEKEKQLRENLRLALLEMAENCERPLCLFLDGYDRFVENASKQHTDEQNTSELVTWFWDKMLKVLAKKSPQPFIVVICGWKISMPSSLAPFSNLQRLDDFQLADVRAYLYKKQVLSPASTEYTPLINAFYKLSQGHPFVLSLAVTYFEELSPEERTVQIIQRSAPWIDERAQTAFLQERLLSCLPEPYNTLLRYGPILRTFDLPALRALLNAVAIVTDQAEQTLDDAAYMRFLQYPFINRTRGSDLDFAGSRLEFHDLIRRVQLHTLRHHYAEQMKQINRAMTNYYEHLVDEEVEKIEESTPEASSAYPRLSDIPEKALKAVIEWFYHALQAEEEREKTFAAWVEITATIIYMHRRQTEKLLEVVRQHAEKGGQAEALLEVVRQLNAEEEEFFNPQGEAYGQYLIMYSRYLEQEARWDDARAELEKAEQLFQQRHDYAAAALCLNNIALIQRARGNVKEALQPLERALEVFQQQGNPSEIALALNNIGIVYQDLGQWGMAIRYLLQTLPYLEQAGDPIRFALTQNNIGLNYQARGELGLAEGYFKQASNRFKEIGDDLNYALTLNNIGLIYQNQGRYFDQALEYFEAALPIYEQLGNAADIATVTSNIGSIYDEQKNFPEALHYYQRALPFNMQEENPLHIINTLQRISNVYYYLEKWDDTLHTLEQLLDYSEKSANTASAASALTQIGAVYQLKKEQEQALAFYLRALTLFESSEDVANIANLLTTIGEIYHERRQWTLALQHYERALALVERLNIPESTAILLAHLAEIQRKQRHWEQALDYYQQIRKLSEHTLNSANIAMTYNNIGEMYQAQRKWQEAFDAYTLAVSVSEHEQDLSTLAASFYFLAELQHEQGLWDLAQRYHIKALSLREQLHDIPAIAHSLNAIAIMHSQQGDWKAALQAYEQAVDLCEQKNEVHYLPILYNDIGNLYSLQGNIEKALEYHQRALTPRQQENNAFALATSFNNIGEVYRCQGKFRAALEAHQLALTYWLQEGDPSAIAISLSNIAGIYDAQGNTQQAIEYLQKSLEHCQNVENPAVTAGTLNNLGGLYVEQGKLEQALQYYRRALKLFQQTGQAANIALLHYNIGLVYQRQTQTQQATEHYKRSLGIYEQLGPGFLRDVASVFDALATCADIDGQQDRGNLLRQQAKRSRKKYRE